jgi:hypothetical protein
MLPALAGSIILLAYVFMGLRGAVIYTAVLSLSRLFYCLPYYYIYFISFGYDSVESLLISALVTVGMILLSAAIFGLTAFAGALAIKLILKLSYTELRSDLAEQMTYSSPLEISSSVSIALSVMALTRFAVYFIRGIVDTVSFLSDYGASFNLAELISIILSLLLPIVFALALYFLLHFMRARVARNRIEEDTETVDRI